MIGIGIVGLILLVLAACIGISEMRVQHGPGTTGDGFIRHSRDGASVLRQRHLPDLLGFSNGITIDCSVASWALYGMARVRVVCRPTQRASRHRDQTPDCCASDGLHCVGLNDSSRASVARGSSFVYSCLAH